MIDLAAHVMKPAEGELTELPQVTESDRSQNNPNPVAGPKHLLLLL